MVEPLCQVGSVRAQSSMYPASLGLWYGVWIRAYDLLYQTVAWLSYTEVVLNQR